MPMMKYKPEQIVTLLRRGTAVRLTAIALKMRKKMTKCKRHHATWLRFGADSHPHPDSLSKLPEDSPHRQQARTDKRICLNRLRRKSTV